MNCREGFLKAAFPFKKIVTIKLEAFKKTLYERNGKKKKKERGGDWLFSGQYKDKYEFVDKMFKDFSNTIIKELSELVDNGVITAYKDQNEKLLYRLVNSNKD